MIFFYLYKLFLEGNSRDCDVGCLQGQEISSTDRKKSFKILFSSDCDAYVKISWTKA